MPVQVSPICRCHLLATMNQLNLDTEGPGIFALQSFLKLQLCWVTATGISYLDKSHQFAAVTPSISLTNLPLKCKLSLI
jgi:hypothetical protein